MSNQDRYTRTQLAPISLTKGTSYSKRSVSVIHGEKSTPNFASGGCRFTMRGRKSTLVGPLDRTVVVSARVAYTVSLAREVAVTTMVSLVPVMMFRVPLSI